MLSRRFLIEFFSSKAWFMQQETISIYDGSEAYIAIVEHNMVYLGTKEIKCGDGKLIGSEPRTEPSQFAKFSV
jgi:hypothetical protein